MLGFAEVSNTADCNQHNQIAKPRGSYYGNVQLQRPPRRLKNPNYLGAKIDAKTFEMLVRIFVLDRAAYMAADELSLSTNTVRSIFLKLRTFFVEVGLFPLHDEAPDPTEHPQDLAEYRLHVLALHQLRVSEMRGLRGSETSRLAHLAETRWRMHHFDLIQIDPIETWTFMADCLFELITCCGPVGEKPSNLEAAEEIIRRQAEDREQRRKNYAKVRY